jgi:hypothetical protein
LQPKSIRGAGGGWGADELPFVDYFPSYEIINAPTFRGGFYEPNQRSVAQAGVNHVMGEFFRCLVAAFPDAMAEGRPRKDPGRGAPRAARKAALPGPGPEEGTEDDLVCEEALLAAFAPKDSRA